MLTGNIIFGAKAFDRVREVRNLELKSPLNHTIHFEHDVVFVD